MRSSLQIAIHPILAELFSRLSRQQFARTHGTHKNRSSPETARRRGAEGGKLHLESAGLLRSFAHWHPRLGWHASKPALPRCRSGSDPAELSHHVFVIPCSTAYSPSPHNYSESHRSRWTPARAQDQHQRCTMMEARAFRGRSAEISPPRLARRAAPGHPAWQALGRALGNSDPLSPQAI